MCFVLERFDGLTSISGMVKLGAPKATLPWLVGLFAAWQYTDQRHAKPPMVSGYDRLDCCAPEYAGSIASTGSFVLRRGAYND